MQYKNVFIGLRLTPELEAKLLRLCEPTGLTRSEMLRLLILRASQKRLLTEDEQELFEVAH